MQRATLSRFQLLIGASSFLLIVITGLFVGGGRSAHPAQHAAAPAKAHVEPLTGAKDKAGNDTTVGKDGTFDIPLPFGGANGAATKGDITQIGRNVYKVTFPAGVQTEDLAEDQIYLVYSPDTEDVNTVAFDIALGQNKDYYGYEYSDSNATVEKNALASAAFNVRFPNKFFASAKALQNDPGLNLHHFAETHSITWRPTAYAGGSEVSMERNQLYLLIVNEAQSTIKVRGNTGFCGNSAVESGEQCDNGTTDGDGCSSQCHLEDGYTCSGNPTVCTWNGARGDLLVYPSSTPVSSKQLLGGGLGGAVLRLTLSARKENIDVTNLNITAKGNGSTAMSVDRLDLYKVGATTPFASATQGGCGNQSIPMLPTVSFCATMDTQQLVVIKDTQTEILVRPVVKSDANGGYISNTPITFTLIPGYGSATQGLTYRPVAARGVTSQEVLHDNDQDSVFEGEVIIGRSSLVPYPDASSNIELTVQSHNIVMAKLASIQNASPDFDGTNIPTGIAQIGRFKFTAAANTNTQYGLDKVTLRDVYFTILLDNVQVNEASAKFFNVADPTAKQDCSFVAGNVGTNMRLIKCSDLNTSSVNVSIDQAANQSFGLQIEVTNPAIVSSQHATMQVSLTDFSSIDKPLFDANGHVVSHIRWADNDSSMYSSNIEQRSYTWFELPYDSVKSTKYGYVVAECGNGVIEGTEQCDDGNQNNTDDCNNQCQISTPLPQF